MAKGTKKQPADASKLSPRQAKAVSMLAGGMLLQEVAERLGVTRQTVSGWKNHHPAFKTKYEELRAEAEDEIGDALSMTDGFMLTQLRRLAQDGPPEVRLRTIQYYLDRRPWPESDAGRNSLLSDSSDMLTRVLNQHRISEVK